ncbi:MAG: SAM-dependent methyltransferase, partial [Candidatus Omnitrophota bacterium]
MEEKRVFSSFRDPSGFLFYRDERLFRQVNKVYREDFELMINSGLYKKLVECRLLIPHVDADIPFFEPEKGYKVIQPEIIPFISYPYEWCFSQLKDAALATLKIQKTAFEFGMFLKDCSAYNIQFYNGLPILIDTLSLQKYQLGEPWVAYRQFCQHFLAPLALMSLKDIRFNQLLRIYMDGVPLDFAKKLLPFKMSLFSHIHLHASVQSYFQDKQIKTSAYKISKVSFMGLVDNLEGAVSKLAWSAKGTEWSDYYDKMGYSAEAFKSKKAAVGDFLDRIKSRNCWDLGANQGVFSRIAADKGIDVVSFDSDPAAVENNYLECVKQGNKNILPLLIDLANPSPCIGWQNQERGSFVERGPADVV